MKKRNYGIDMLRIVSMYMIVLLHIVGFSEIADYTDWNSTNYILCNFIRSFTYCGVNCFALISGYVGIEADFKFSRIVMSWLRVIWYSITLNIVLAVFLDVKIDMYLWMTALFPVSMTAYWYFTQYFRMYFLIPFMNKFIRKTPKKIVFVTLLIILILVFFNQEKVANGYHFLWLAILYLCGAYIRKYNPFSNFGINCFLIIYVMSSLLTLFNYMLYDVNIYDFSLEEYTSPTVFMAAMCLLFVFSKLQFGENIQVGIAKISPLVFSVYLFHTQPVFFKDIIQGCLKSYSNSGIFISIILIIGLSFFIYFVSCVYEYIRALLVKKFDLEKKIDLLIQEIANKSRIIKKLKLDWYFSSID